MHDDRDRATTPRVPPATMRHKFSRFLARLGVVAASVLGAVSLARSESLLWMALGSLVFVGAVGFLLGRGPTEAPTDRSAEDRELVGWFVTLLVAFGGYIFACEIEAPLFGDVARDVISREAPDRFLVSEYVFRDSYAVPSRARTYVRKGRYGSDAGRCTVVPVLDADRLPDGPVHVWWMRRERDDEFPIDATVRVVRAVRVVGAWADDCKRAAQRDPGWDPDAIVVRAVRDDVPHGLDGVRSTAVVIGVAAAVQAVSEAIASLVMRARRFSASSRARRGASR